MYECVEIYALAIIISLLGLFSGSHELISLWYPPALDLSQFNLQTMLICTMEVHLLFLSYARSSTDAIMRRRFLAENSTLKMEQHAALCVWYVYVPGYLYHNYLELQTKPHVTSVSLCEYHRLLVVSCEELYFILDVKII
jgi:hypothetical protein